MHSSDNLYGCSYAAYQLNRSALRKSIRRLYLRNIRRLIEGPAIDFGCGVGELLQILPAGSVGLEINESAVRHCRSRGMDVRLYDPASDGYQFNGLEPGVFRSFVMSHVLEHLDQPMSVAGSIFTSCARLAIPRIIFVVPGVKGFRSDKTHRTFIDGSFFAGRVGEYRKLSAAYFPVNVKLIGSFFTHHELVVVYDRQDKS